MVPGPEFWVRSRPDLGNNAGLAVLCTAWTATFYTLNNWRIYIYLSIFFLFIVLKTLSNWEVISASLNEQD